MKQLRKNIGTKNSIYKDLAHQKKGRRAKDSLQGMIYFGMEK
jgi:hypothetical protein